MLSMLTSIHNSNSSDSLTSSISSSESYVSHSLSSLINQRKLQKINNKSKASTKYHYKKNQKKKQEKVDGHLKNSAKRRRSSSYWYNTNINNVFETKIYDNCNNNINEFDEENIKDPFVNADFTSKKNKNNKNSKLFDVTIHNELEDLDFLFEYSISDIKEYVEPVYDITKHRPLEDNGSFFNIKAYISKKMSSNLNEKEIKEEVELKEVGFNKDEEKSVSVISSPKPVQNISKEIMQPHFMRLYALEQRSRNNGSLPDLDIDENLLSQLSYQDIWTLDVPTESTEAELKKLEELKIKLALMTRKKLWCDMIIQKENKTEIQNSKVFVKDVNKQLIVNKSDLDYIKLRSLVTSLNDNKFKHIGYEGNYTDKITSLVRLNKKGTLPWDGIRNSDTKNYKFDDSKSSNMINEMKKTLNLKTIQPFGKLPNSKHTQYLVKGWVDKRFHS